MSFYYLSNVRVCKTSHKTDDFIAELVDILYNILNTIPNDIYSLIMIPKLNAFNENVYYTTVRLMQRTFKVNT